MGYPLGPVLVNLFMGYYETLRLNTFRECEIILYRRYVDDIICLFTCESKFFEFLNAQHPNVKFTLNLRQIYVKLINNLHFRFPKRNCDGLIY